MTLSLQLNRMPPRLFRKSLGTLDEKGYLQHQITSTFSSMTLPCPHLKIACDSKSLVQGKIWRRIWVAFSGPWKVWQGKLSWNTLPSVFSAHANRGYVEGRNMRCVRALFRSCTNLPNWAATMLAVNNEPRSFQLP